jgi:hypothetical protein
VSASDVDWRALLVLWSGEIIGRPDLARHLSPDVRARGWLGFPAASEEQIRAAEARLGTYLPPSYRQFLKVSNGWRVTGTFAGRVYSCEEIRWFRVEHQDWIDAYVTPPAPAPHRMWSLSDAEYFVYGDDQDPARIRPEYLQTALEISAVGDSALYLLNPTVVSDDGEWEAWHFANWLPGANRFRSFWEMMIAEHASFVAAR